MMRRLIEHIHAHPIRLLVTLLVLVLLAWSAAVTVLVISLDTAHQGRVENCRAVNELSRKIYTTAADVGVPLQDRLKFLPSTNCEALP